MPSFSGFIPVKDLNTVFSDSKEWITIYTQETALELENAPFIPVSFQIIPEEPIETKLTVNQDNGIVEKIQIKRKSISLIRPS